MVKALAKAAILRSPLFFMTAAVFFFAGLTTCSAANVIWIHRRPVYRDQEEMIRRVVNFYGLTLHVVDGGSQDEVDRAVERLRNPETFALIASHAALPVLDWKQILPALQRPKRKAIPMLVLGVSALEKPDELKLWSDGAIQGCTPLATDFQPRLVKVGSAGSLAGTLAGSEYPAVASPLCSMRIGPTPAVETVLAAHGDGGTAAVLIRAQLKAGEIFFSPQMREFDPSWRGVPRGLQGAFSSMAPYILFLRYAAGEYGWHSVGHYANLTIDDAWLTQPYGHLDYPALLEEMKKHNFHTTIAFIPWNFDRSDPLMAALFRGHPERFSLSLHGNDHAHREFGDYTVNSLGDQVADIKQGVARMERFQALTGIPYDRFMVFPHGVAPEATFAALKEYGFLGTANATHVPLGAGFPMDSAFLLRPYTVAYGNFLSLSRYAATSEVPRVEVAMQSFLGNPLLFYSHENLFDQGIGAFNGLADLVNQVQPESQWTSLGAMARHLHLVRRRLDGGMDVQMFSNEMDLDNPADRETLFYVARGENHSPSLRSLTVDGAPANYERHGETLTLRVLIPARQGRRVRVEYENDLDPSREDIRKRNLYSYALRRISDFRDLYLSRSSWGHAIKSAYYGHGWNSIEVYLEQKWWAGVAILALALAGFRYYRREARKRTVGSAAMN